MDSQGSTPKRNQNKENDEKVTNLSKYKLKESEISLLTKGLKFIPDRSKVDTIKLLADLAEWDRRMRLREYFHKEKEEEEDEDDTDFNLKTYTLN